jgi:hypothetical protein
MEGGLAKSGHGRALYEPVRIGSCKHIARSQSTNGYTIPANMLCSASLLVVGSKQAAASILRERGAKYTIGGSEGCTISNVRLAFGMAEEKPTPRSERKLGKGPRLYPQLSVLVADLDELDVSKKWFRGGGVG